MAFPFVTFANLIVLYPQKCINMQMSAIPVNLTCQCQISSQVRQRRSCPQEAADHRQRLSDCRAEKTGRRDDVEVSRAAGGAVVVWPPQARPAAGAPQLPEPLQSTAAPLIPP
jgi:hypothetical protein